ncbi:MAG: chromosome segregation protein SMC [Desulfarculus sp.]|nr:chromosome segregation protein SMC [Desulfarculus sp.]
MRVRRLEINGFKSFAERVVADFPQGLCAVVGPNGCGKSNVVDAVRWVLGEQSAKVLRGHSMEDVIFNGSDKRKATGLAEVSLVFDNTGSLTNPQFADLPEIMVTRRLYRNGDSEYLINKVACRLKDIQQLFMDTGLGNRSYAIIEQGRVAAFIEAKPEDRRLWVEEAAGITRYKNQKKISLRKMEASKENLDRLQDILHEVHTQMERLRRQSQKAVVHRDLRERIRELDLNLSSFEFARLRDDTATAQAEADAVAAQLMLANQVVTNLETELEAVRVRLLSAEEEISQAGTRRLEAQGAIQKAENELTLLGREAENLRRLKERYEEERRQLKSRLAEQERQLDKARRLARESQDSLAGSQEAAQRISEEVCERQEALTTLEQRVDAAKHGLVDHMSAISQQRNRLGDMERQQSELQRRQESLSGRRQTLEDELSRVEADRQQAQESLDLARAELEESEASLTRLSRQRDEYQQRLIGLRRAEQEATRRRHGLDASVKALGDALGSHDWAQAGVRRVMAEAKAGKLPVTVLGLVAEKLTVRPGAEALVEAALGPDVQAVIVPDGPSALALGQYVAQENLGRLRVVALHELTGRLDHPAGSEPLAGLVKPEPGHEALAALWMATGHSPDLAGAWSAAAALEPGQVVVSALGERLDRPGAASLGRGKAEPVLTRQNELKRRREELAQAEEAQAEAAEAREAAEAEVVRLEEEHRQRRGSHQEQERDLRRREQELFRLREATGVKERQLEGLEYDAGEIWSELNRLETEGARLGETLAGLEGKSAELEQGLAAAQMGLGQGRQDLERARAQEGEARLAVASLQNAAEQSLREAKRLGQEMEAAQERLLALSADAQGAGDTLESVLARRKAEENRLGGLYAEMDRQEEAYRQAREVLSQAQARAADLESRLKQGRLDQRRVEAESQTLGLRLKELDLASQHLCEQVRERCRVELAAEYQAHLPEGPFQPGQAKERLAKLRQRLMRLGPVNMEAISEFEALSERHQFLSEQKADLEASLDDLRSAIRKINKTSRTRFTETLTEVNQRLEAVFPVLFGGGQARLELDQDVDPLESGLHLMVELPGKKVKNLEALSGGEKALSAVAVLFALFLIRPAPFCILDEVDAPLDEANAGRFHDLLRQLSGRSQILMVTHNRRTMEIMDLLYGVTMEERGVSKMLAVNLAQGESLAA